jgi:hypothetical protein
MPLVANEANAAARITVAGGATGETTAAVIVEVTAVAGDAGAAVVDATVVEVVDVTRGRADVICRLQNMLRRKAANRAVTIGVATTIADNNTAVTIIGGRKAHVPADLRFPWSRGKNRSSSRVNRSQSTGANPR